MVCTAWILQLLFNQVVWSTGGEDLNLESVCPGMAGFPTRAGSLCDAVSKVCSPGAWIGTPNLMPACCITSDKPSVPWFPLKCCWRYLPPFVTSVTEKHKVLLVTVSSASAAGGTANTMVHLLLYVQPWKARYPSCANQIETWASSYWASESVISRGWVMGYIWWAFIQLAALCPPSPSPTKVLAAQETWYLHLPSLPIEQYMPGLFK